ncbi:262_t:CDS:2, partial [Gigaspora rosea]
MDAPSGKALSSQSLSISSSSFFPSPTIIMAVPSGSSNPSSLPTDHSITPTPFRSINTFSTSASIISSTILNSPTEFASPAQNSKTNENLPIIISITVFSTLLIGALLLAYIRTRHKRQRQHALATAIIAAEAGFDDNGNRIEPSAVAINQPRSPPRYKISTLQIEPMTRRLTLNLHQK